MTFASVGTAFRAARGALSPNASSQDLEASQRDQGHAPSPRAHHRRERLGTISDSFVPATRNHAADSERRSESLARNFRVVKSRLPSVVGEPHSPKSESGAHPRESPMPAQARTKEPEPLPFRGHLRQRG